MMMQSYNTVETQTQTQQRRLPAMISAAAGMNLTAQHNVLAERYKTKMCKNYLEMGMCPYEVRCMLAHGEDELRTTEMNLHDGIVTEESIRTFKRMQTYKMQAQQAAMDATDGGYSSPSFAARRPPSYEHSSFMPYEEVDYNNYDVHSPNGGMGSRKNSSHCMSFTTAGDTFCYDPYGWTPYHNEANPHCECADCLYMAEVEYSQQEQRLEAQSRADSAVQSPAPADDDEPETTAQHRRAPVPFCSAPPTKTVAATSQADVAGQPLRRPMMP